MTEKQKRVLAVNRVREWRAKNPERVKEYQKRHWTLNRDRLIKRARRWYRENKGKARNRAHQYYLKNKEAISIKAAKRRMTHAKEISDYLFKYRRKPSVKNKYKKYFSAYYRKHRDKYIIRARAHYEKDKDRYTKNVRAWAKAHPNELRRYRRNRRARRLGQMGVVSKNIEAILMKKQNGLCVYCSISLSKSGHHLDHIMPLRLGGLHDNSNLQLACPRCNQTKSCLHPKEFARKLRNTKP